MAALLLVAGTVVLAPRAQAQQSPCGERTSYRFGETAADVAQRCGVNAEKLRDLNPQIELNPPNTGTIVNVPPPALPRAMPLERGNPAMSTGIPGARWRR